MQIVDYKIPFDMFSEWFKKANAKSEIIEPTAMCLSTVDENNHPSSRMILLKKFDERGFCFFTNLTSRKGRELAHNPNVSLCLYWGILGYQIRIEGKIEKVTNKEADDYFITRRRGSQIGAWASKQSHVMPNDEEFQARISQITEDFANQDVPRPPFWSGFRVVPEKIEFWQEGEFRIHRRDLFCKTADGKAWQLTRLYP